MTDEQAAELLGMTRAAFEGVKTRLTFPECRTLDDLKAFKLRRAEAAALWSQDNDIPEIHPQYQADR
jgi:hypothetical protein